MLIPETARPIPVRNVSPNSTFYLKSLTIYYYYRTLFSVKKNVLILCDEFPPDRSGRAEKMWRRAKYLARFGWAVTVLAPNTAGNNSITPVDSETLNVTLHRTPYLFQKRWPSLKHNKERGIITRQDHRFARLLDLLFVPKGYIRWLPYALVHGFRLARSTDILFTVNNPISLHLIGLVLKLITGKPWVAEFRDAIVGYRYTMRGPEVINQFMERAIVNVADAVIVGENYQADDILQRYAHLSQKFLHLDKTGYDPDEFVDYDVTYTRQKPLTIVYTGSFYGSTIVPDPFLKALAQCVEQCKLTPADIQVRFAGDWSDKYTRLVGQLGLDEFVTYLGWLTFKECQTLWSQSDVLLLILGQEEAEEGLLPSKLWDYAAARRFILCLAPPKSRTAKIIGQNNVGTSASPTEIDAIVDALAQVWCKFEDNSLDISSSQEFISSASCVDVEKQIANKLSMAL